MPADLPDVTASPDAVRFGLVGYGFGARYFHAPLLAASPACELVAVMTSDPQRRALVADEHPGVLCADSLAARVEAGAEAVSISTPASTHSELTDAALELGLAVVCDKPFALSATAAAASADLAEALHLPLSPYQNRRWDSDFRTVRSLVEAGALGDILRFESRFERFKPDSGPAPSGGGTLLDLGSHLVDQALVLLGQVQSVYAEWTIRQNGLDDDVFVALGHVNGGRSHLWASSMQAAPGPRFRVSGTRAAYLIGRPLDGQEAALVAVCSPATEGADWGREPAETWGRLVRGEEHELIETLPGAWDDFYAEFAGAVRGEGPAPVTAAEAVETARVLDAAAASAAGGEVIWLEDRSATVS